MLTRLDIRAATPADLQTIGAFVTNLGYTARRDVLHAMLGPMLEDPRHIVLLGQDAGHGVVALLSLSSRPVLRLQGWVGTIEEFVVRPGVRDRGIGDRMLQYAKGLAAERGWVRLEAVVARRRESHRRGFLLERGFVQADNVTYRLGRLEGRHQVPPSLYPERRSAEMV
jgi:N-acetylglutamate synthase-like GNAT family acetyltransferase